MLSVWAYTLGSVFIVSLVSLIGVFTLSIRMEKLNRILLFFVSFSAGALLGGVFIHLLPELSETIGIGLVQGLLVLGGIVVFFILEKFVHWHHCHDVDCEGHKHHIGIINLVADGLHNLIDGMLIAGSFLINIPVGIATSVGVLLHEIPQEIGDFALLLHSGYSRAKALLFNFLSALVAVVGAVIVLLLESAASIKEYIIPVTIGGFLYLALADIFPELHKETKISRSFGQFFSFLLGIGVMALLLME